MTPAMTLIVPLLIIAVLWVWSLSLSEGRRLKRYEPMVVVVGRPDELVLVRPAHLPPLSAEQIERCREALKAWKDGAGPVLIEGFEVQAAISRPGTHMHPVKHSMVADR